MFDPRTQARLAEVSLGLIDAVRLEGTCEALEKGHLSRNSTSASRAAVARGSAVADGYLRTLIETWRELPLEITGNILAMVLQAAAATVTARDLATTTTQVVWSGPRVEGSFLRATREVIREIVANCTTELLVVGYWIASREDGEGVVRELIASFAGAVNRGASVTVVVDERARSDGRDNRQILLAGWPSHVVRPRLLTWRIPPNDKHLKLHAKVLVADRMDGLVTSANLTGYAMDRNMEMGVRIGGRPAADIARHFDLLARAGILETYT